MAKVFRSLFLWGGVVVLGLVSGSLLLLWMAASKIGHLSVTRSSTELVDGDGAEGAARYVDMLWATGGHPLSSGMLTPAVGSPGGLVRLGPDTGFGRCMLCWHKLLSNRATAGYYYDASNVIGFSHTRLIGTGAREGGLYRILPLRDPNNTNAIVLGHEFSHANERALLDEYKLAIPEKGIKVRMTARGSTGLHVYEFDARAGSYLFVDVASVIGQSTYGERPHVTDPSGSFKGGVIEAQTTLQGFFSSRYGGLKSYARIRFFPEPDKVGVYENGMVNWKKTSLAKVGEVYGPAGFMVQYNKPGKVGVKVDVSYSAPPTKESTQAWEGRFLDFYQSYFHARNALNNEWQSKLGLVEIETSESAVRQLFYTALANVFRMPTRMNQRVGEEVLFDGKRLYRDFLFYSDLSLWDVYRTTFPLWSLIDLDLAENVVRSLVLMGEGGDLPMWPSGTGRTGDMIGRPAQIVVADAYKRGLGGADYPSMLAKMMNQGEESSSGGNEYASCKNKGYCPSDKIQQSVSKTLEYAWADWALAKLAEGLGQGALSRDLQKSASEMLTNLWSEKDKFFLPKNSKEEFSHEPLKAIGPLKKIQRWLNSFDDYTEGTPEQWRFSLLPMGKELVGLYESPEDFVKDLDEFLGSSIEEEVGELVPPLGYWHGNQPGLGAAYLFLYADRPDLTQKWVRKILGRKYQIGPAGLDGNDDSGTLSAWYVLSTLGIYPIPGSGEFLFGIPNVKSAKVKLWDGRELQMETEAFIPENGYVAAIYVDGVKQCKPNIRHKDLVAAKKIRYRLTSHPVKTFYCP